MQLAPALGKRFPTGKQTQTAVSAHTLERTRILRLGDELDKAGIKPGALMAEGLQEIIPVGHTAELRPGSAAAGDDELIAVERLTIGDDRPAGIIAVDLPGGGGGLNFNTRLLQREAEHIKDGIGRI